MANDGKTYKKSRTEQFVWTEEGTGAIKPQNYPEKGTR
jgi:hypothetical protein